MKNIFIGTSGFLYSHWIGDFYPPDLKREEFLGFYSKHFKTVEINSTFYHLPRQKTIKKWLKQVPKDFIFTFKLSRFVTHFGKLDPKVKSFRLFFEAIKSLKSSPPKHLILIQTPASFKVDTEKLKNFLEALPKTFLYAFEFRHESWFEEEVYRVLKKHNIAVVLSDSPIKKMGGKVQSIPPARKSVNCGMVVLLKSASRLWPYVNVDTTNFFYIRFHGSKRLFASSYSDEELKFYTKIIKEKIKKGMDVYCYFNNDAEGAAVVDAKRLKTFLSRF